MIRYFCHADAYGPRADLCARYAEAFVALGYRTRVIPVEMVHASSVPPGMEHRWKYLQPLFSEPVTIPYTNVICSHPFWWSRLFTVGVRNVLITGETPESAAEIAQQVPASARRASGTKSQVVNGQAVDFELMEVPHEPPDPCAIAGRFDSIVVPSAEIRQRWQTVIDEVTTQVDCGEASDRGVCQVVVIGLDLAERAQALRKVLADG